LRVAPAQTRILLSVWVENEGPPGLISKRPLADGIKAGSSGPDSRSHNKRARGFLSSLQTRAAQAGINPREGAMNSLRWVPAALCRPISRWTKRNELRPAPDHECRLLQEGAFRERKDGPRSPFFLNWIAPMTESELFMSECSKTAGSGNRRDERCTHGGPIVAKNGSGRRPAGGDDCLALRSTQRNAADRARGADLPQLVIEGTARFRQRAAFGWIATPAPNP